MCEKVELGNYDTPVSNSKKVVDRTRIKITLSNQVKDAEYEVIEVPAGAEITSSEDSPSAKSSPERASPASRD